MEAVPLAAAALMVAVAGVAGAFMALLHMDRRVRRLEELLRR